MKSDLSPTMLNGLIKMHEKLKRWSFIMAEPNENTGKALEKRGYIKFVQYTGAFRTYVLTEAGEARVAQALKGGGE